MKKKKRQRRGPKTQSEKERNPKPPQQRLPRQDRTKMEIASYIFGFAGAVALIIVGVAFSLGHKGWGIWGSCAALCCASVAAAAWMHDKVIKPASAQAAPLDLLIPASDPTPEIPPEGFPKEEPPGLIPPSLAGDITWKSITTPSDDEVLLFLNNIAVSTSAPEFTVMRVYGKDVLKLAKLEGGLSISADIWSKDGRILATIENNRFRVNPNNTLPILKPDPHTLIVEDERKTQVLYVRFLNPKAIQIRGIFRGPGRYPVIAEMGQVSFGPITIGAGVVLHLAGDPLFEWPGGFSKGQKTIFAPEGTSPAIGKAVIGSSKWKGGGRFFLKTDKGEEFSILNLGGKGAPKGYTVIPMLTLQIKKDGTY